MNQFETESETLLGKKINKQPVYIVKFLNTKLD